MRAISTFPFVLNPDGTMVRDAAGDPVATWAVFCTLNGEACDNFMADEEAGVVEVPVRDADGKLIRREDGEGWVTKFLTGDVKLTLTPVYAQDWNGPEGSPEERIVHLNLMLTDALDNLAMMSSLESDRIRYYVMSLMEEKRALVESLLTTNS